MIKREALDLHFFLTNSLVSRLFSSLVGAVLAIL
jgi:hypothetical protein